jgi:hypothetical protein
VVAQWLAAESVQGTVRSVKDAVRRSGPGAGGQDSEPLTMEQRKADREARLTIKTSAMIASGHDGMLKEVTGR